MGALISLAMAAVMTPVTVSVPAHVEYCLSSNAIPGSEYAKPETRSAVFDALSDRIEQAGLTARALTIGVPFVDDVKRTPSPKQTAADADEAHATYVIRLCAVVPAKVATAFPPPAVVHVPARQVLASLCHTGNLDDCRQAVENAVRSAESLGASQPVLLRTRQALSSDPSSTSLAAALSDASLIVLRQQDQSLAPSPSPPAPSVPADLAVVSGEPAN